jgi:predicted phosphodiesterase
LLCNGNKITKEGVRMARVLVIGDLHIPAVHPEYLDFCKSLKKKYKTNATVFIGDILDHNAISFHKKHPEAASAIKEYRDVQEGMKVWKKAFKEAKICIGNHDERVHRLAADSGIPSVYLKDYAEIYDTPNWEWSYLHMIDGVLYTHGTGLPSQYPAFNLAKSRACSVVSGHSHSIANVNWFEGQDNFRVFGMNVGAGVDIDHIAMNYSKNHIKKSICAAGVVIDGHPYLELMNKELLQNG